MTDNHDIGTKDCLHRYPAARYNHNTKQRADCWACYPVIKSDNQPPPIAPCGETLNNAVCCLKGSGPANVQPCGNPPA